ncbi:hypothetical protein DPMN_050025 [Dreissena polymorpha]|uniref:Uncharacterized protein n=1 Tax=Dreissena polymorpha TaxID=45954 RepID=A0A9D4HMM6_DREPO|nr:hypothetical protein DPMN_050025 [Dreissena polymorpha]
MTLEITNQFILITQDVNRIDAHFSQQVYVSGMPLRPTCNNPPQCEEPNQVVRIIQHLFERSSNPSRKVAT